MPENNGLAMVDDQGKPWTDPNTQRRPLRTRILGGVINEYRYDA